MTGEKIKLKVYLDKEDVCSFTLLVGLSDG